MDIQGLLPKSGVIDDLLLERDVGINSIDDHLAQRAAHPLQRLFPILTKGDDLCNQRVVEGGTR